MMDVFNNMKQFTLFLWVISFTGYNRAATINQIWKSGVAWKTGATGTCNMATNQSNTYNLRAHYAESLIQCLSSMQAKDASLRAVTYNVSTNQCAIVDDPTAVPDNGFQYITEKRAFPVFNASEQVICNNSWKKEFEVAADGSVLYGDHATITAAVKAMVEIRIHILPDLIVEVDNVAIISGLICTSSIFVLSKSSWDTFKTSMFWRFTMVCSDGKVHQGRTYLGKKVSLSDVSSSKQSIWYTRTLNTAATHAGPAYCADSSSQPKCGNIPAVVSAVEKGKNVRLAYDFGGSSFYQTSVFRLEVEHVPCAVVGQIPWKIGKASSNGRYFSPFYWFMCLFDTMSKRKVSRWYIGEHTLKSESLQSLHTYWLIDSCWDLIFKHSANGEPIFGSSNTLIDLILQGRRVRLLFGPYSLEADNVVIDNSLVTAQLLSQIDTPTARSFTAGDAVWKWVRLSSDGTYAADLYDLGSSNRKGQETSTIQAAWVVESRLWRMVLTTDPNGVEVIGSKSDLKQAVSAGSRLRCIVLVQPTSTLVVTADNIQIHVDGNIAVQVFRLISFDGPSGFVPFWRILIITTNGEMKETRWTVGKHEHRGNAVSRVTVNWFVD